MELTSEQKLQILNTPAGVKKIAEAAAASVKQKKVASVEEAMDWVGGLSLSEENLKEAIAQATQIINGS